MPDSFATADRLTVDGRDYRIFRLDRLEGAARLPFALKLLLENLLRHEDGKVVIAAITSCTNTSNPSRMDIDLVKKPLAVDAAGRPVYLRDIRPSQAEVMQTMATAVSAEQFSSVYADIFEGDANWDALAAGEGRRYAWTASAYIANPPYFEQLPVQAVLPEDIDGARVLALLGDSVTTDHISPAGSIAVDSPAGHYLQAIGVEPAAFNSYGSRRGNHQVMMRGTFANTRLHNLLAPGTEGGVTLHLPSAEQMPIYDAAMRYAADGVPVIIIAGREYGSGSSRDWAAKGPRLLGVRAVIAESYERIHRSNLIGMGILPLQFPGGESAATLGLDGHEVYAIEGLQQGEAQQLRVVARRADGSETAFTARVRIDTPQERRYYRHGGILPFMARRLAAV